MSQPNTAKFIDQVRKSIGLFVCTLFFLTVGVSFLGYDIPIILWIVDLFVVLGLFTIYVIDQNLLQYVFKRVGEAIFVLWVIATSTFLLLRLIPGGPFDEEKALPQEVKANIEAKYNLNASLLDQYSSYMLGVVQGDLGESYKFIGRPISEIIMETLPTSFQLGIFALVLSYLVGVPAGVYAASKHNKIQDNLTMVATISGVSMPSFLVAPNTNCYF